MRLVRVMALMLAGLCPAVAVAQPQEPVGPFVVDIRGITLGLPTAAGWTVELPEGGLVPGRGLGLEGGAHVYVGRLGPARIGLGAALGLARGTATTGEPEDPEDPDVPVGPTGDVITRATTLAPQLSLNFGHKLGWSYLSAGYGAARIGSRATLQGTEEMTTGWVSAINIGGGARWFLSDHLGFGFDLRWHRLSAPVPAIDTAAAPPRATLFQFAVGLSIQ